MPGGRNACLGGIFWLEYTLGVQIVLATWNNGNPTPEFNNAAQIFNHEFYWESMSPNGGGALASPKSSPLQVPSRLPQACLKVHPEVAEVPEY